RNKTRMKLAASIFYGILLSFVTIGIRDVLFVYEDNKCSMTYMYEYPEYQKLKLPRKLSRRYPSYGLYLYGEGVYAEENKNLKLEGIPVLFLPGNAGSYKQVRSLGSVALRKAEDIDEKFHFNFFSIDFNEELVALYGGSLQRQTKFVHECIKVILKLYKDQEYAPNSVAIVGHSMGGLVARALLTLPGFKPELISLIITQATPHIAPVLTLDSYLIDFYISVNDYWIEKAQALRNVTVLSVGGGFRDYQVRSGLTVLPSLHFHNNTLSVVTSSVPRAWASTDHLCIVWCKEIVLATVRAFFDLVDTNTKQINGDPERKKAVLYHHFIRHPVKVFEDGVDEVVTFAGGSSKWTKVKAARWTYISPEEPRAKHFIFPLSSHRKTYSHFYCQSDKLDTASWLYGCITSSNQSICLEGVDLSWKVELLPTFKTATLKLEDYASLSHIVILVPKGNGEKQYRLDCEFFKEDSRRLIVPVTHVFSFGISASKVVLNSSGLVHSLQLQDFNQIYQAFKIHIDSHCRLQKERKPNVYRVHVPWLHEDSITVASVPSSTEISAKLHAARPENDSTVLELQLYTSPDCQYKVTIQTSFFQVLGQVIRFHGACLPVYVVANILLAYGGQLYTLLSTGHCIQFDEALDAAAKPYKVDPIVNIIRFLLRFNWFKVVWAVLFLPELDILILTAQGTWYPLVSLLLFLFGTGIAYWSGIVFCSSLELLSSLWSFFQR
uniref:GPI inositol-deacylase n=1 Tax=Latimeria chalumnae TaxID=7897 RepID=H3AZ46_LATCH